MLLNYGFSDIQAEAALIATSSNLEQAADWLFSHADIASITPESVAAAAAAAAASSGANGGVGGAGAPPVEVPALDKIGDAKYELLSVISHIGRNTDHGHYVCHRKVQGKGWVLFNDEKVAACKAPPLEHGFMYLYGKL